MMEIGTNELTRPFRIPRRKTGEETLKESDDKSKRKRGAGDSDLRSPLIASASTRKNDSTFSSRIVPPTKRKASQEHRGTAVKKNAAKLPSSGGEVFDKILGSMVNPPKERKPDVPKERDEPGPSGTSAQTRQQQQQQRGGIRQLTREELERQHVDNSACYAFLRKDGLMERLLGHKMLTGRVDSHIALGYLPFDPNEQAPSRKANYASSSAFEEFPKICEPPPVAVAAEERRGPRTPPGSPGREDNSSLMTSRGAASASPSSPPPPPPPEEVTDAKKAVDDSSNLIAEMAELTKLPHSQLAECLGEELQNAMKQVDQAVLLSTLKDALIKVGKKNASEMESSQLSQAIQDGSTKLLAMQQQQQHMQNAVDISSPAVEMDIESDRSDNDNEMISDQVQVLPPPPPAPSTPPHQSVVHLLISGANAIPSQTPPTVNIIPTPRCILPTPPPPPPVVLQPAPPPPVIPTTSTTLPVPQPPSMSLVNTGLVNTAPVSTTPILISSFNTPPPIPFVASNQQSSLNSTPSLHQDTSTLFCGGAVGVSSSVSNVVTAASLLHTTTSAQLTSFTTPPPPAMPNTALPPPVTPFITASLPRLPVCPSEIASPTPNIASAISVSGASVGVQQSESSATLLIAPSIPPLHTSPLLASVPVNNLPSTPVKFTPSLQQQQTVPVSSSSSQPQAQSSEETKPLRMPLLTTPVDFSKPPPLSSATAQLTASNVHTSPNCQSVFQQTFNVPPPVKTPSSSCAPVKEPVFPSSSHPTFPRPNGDAKRSFNESVSPMKPRMSSVAKETFVASSPYKEHFVRSERRPLVSTPPVQQSSPSAQRQSVIVAEQSQSTPTSQNVIRTLMSALAIPTSSSNTITNNKSMLPSNTISNSSVCTAAVIDISQPPPGGSIVNSRSDSPVLLDRYGCPLPVPAKRSALIDRVQPHTTMMGNVLSSSNSEGFPSRSDMVALRKPPTDVKTEEEDAELVDFSWPPANIEDQQRLKSNGTHNEHAAQLQAQQKQVHSRLNSASKSSAQRAGTSVSAFNEHTSAAQFHKQRNTNAHHPHPPNNDIPNRPLSLIRNPPAVVRMPPPFGMPPPFRMRAHPPFPLRRPPPPASFAHRVQASGGRAMRPTFRR